MNILYIIFKDVIWRYKLFREIFKFRENTSKNRFREISSTVHKIAKFKHFSKIITYSKSPDYVLQSFVYNMFIFLKFGFFRTYILEPLLSHFAKIAHKVAKSKYF